MSACYSCSQSFDTVAPHKTDVKFDGVGTHGVASLCETCWAAKTPAERLPFYIRLYNAFPSRNYSLKELQRAVMNEKPRTIRPVQVRIRRGLQ